MNKSELNLLKKLHKGGTAVQGLFHEEWDGLYNEAKKHSVVNVISADLPDDIPDDFKAEFDKTYYNQMTLFVRYIKAQDDLCRILGDNGIKFAILKGSAAAVYYPEPIRRNMGDIDFIVPVDEFDWAQYILLENGFDLSHDDEMYESHTAFLRMA